MVNPDGKSIAVQIRCPTSSDNIVAALVPVECLERPQEDCSPKIIGNGFPEDIWSPHTEMVNWSNDGHKLAYLDMLACMSGTSVGYVETKLWIYDLEAEQGRLVKVFPGKCLDVGPGPWTPSGTQILLSDMAYPYTLWRVSVDTGDMSPLTAASTGSERVLGLFQVP
jgi:hypothetical protein